MPYLGLLFVAHVCLLLLRARSVSRIAFSSSFPVFFASVVLVWTNLLHTSYVASLVGLLESPVAYFAISAGLFYIYEQFFRMVCPAPAPHDGITLPDLWAEARKSAFVLAAWAVLAVLTIGVLLLAISVLANNWDTLAYRFPRVLFYLNGIGLMHPGTGLDPRLQSYPYNGSLLYLFLAQYQLTGVSWNFVSVLAWLVCGAGAFYVPLSLGGSVRAATFSAFAVLTTPIVLCLATSTNDEVIAAAPMLLAVIFAAAWLRNTSTPGFIFTALSIGIGTGTKLHWGFYIFAVLGALAYGVVRQRAALIGIWKQSVPTAVLVPTLLLAVPLTTAFMVTNYSSRGEISDSNFNKGVLNSPFSPSVALQTFKIYSFQLLLSPIAEHARIFGTQSGNDAVQATNQWANKWLFSDVKQGPPYSTPYYQFRGVSDPDASSLFEQTLWLGLAPLFLLAVLIVMAIRRNEFDFYTWLLILSLPCWHLAFAIMTKYVECVGTYYSYAVPIGLAPLGYIWERLKTSENSAARILAKVMPVLLVSNALVAAVILIDSPKRNLTQAFTFTDGETPVSQTSSSLRPIVAKAKHVHIAYTHWELLYWNLMRLNPAAKYYTQTVPQGKTPDLYLNVQTTAYTWDAPAAIRGGRLGDFRLAGTMGLGSDTVFCTGPVCDTECPACENFFLLPLQSARSGAAMELSLKGAPIGLNLAQRGFVKFTYFGSAAKTSAASDWVALASLPTFKQSFPDAGFDHLQVEVSCEAGPTCPLAKTVLALRPGVRYLFDNMPELVAPASAEKVSEIFGGGWEGTEGSGYWSFKWVLRPGTNQMDASWNGKGGEKINDVLTVTTLNDKEVRLLRSTTNSYMVGRWLSNAPPTAEGYTVWDKTNFWQGRKTGAKK